MASSASSGYRGFQVNNQLVEVWCAARHAALFNQHMPHGEPGISRIQLQRPMERLFIIVSIDETSAAHNHGTAHGYFSCSAHHLQGPR